MEIYQKSYLIGGVFKLVVLALGGKLVTSLGTFPATVRVGHDGQAKNSNGSLHSLVN